MKHREAVCPPQHYTSAEWINREGPNLGPWPLAKKQAGDRSRVKSGQTARVEALLRRLEREGIK